MIRAKKTNALLIRQLPRVVLKLFNETLYVYCQAKVLLDNLYQGLPLNVPRAVTVTATRYKGIRCWQGGRRGGEGPGGGGRHGEGLEASIMEVLKEVMGEKEGEKNGVAAYRQYCSNPSALTQVPRGTHCNLFFLGLEEDLRVLGVVNHPIRVLVHLRDH